MKTVYVILAFHAHELLWNLPDKLLSYLNDDNPMKDSLLTRNYLKERKKEGRDIYSLCSEFGDRLNAPLCVEYTNELLIQIKKIMPEVFTRLKNDYRRGRLYPLYGHAHHTHVSLLKEEEITQEILFNKKYLHNDMDVPYPGYSGLFPPEASLNYNKFTGIINAGIDYVIFPHLERDKVAYKIEGDGDITYRPFVIKQKGKITLAFPRNFPISQEIWRPITKIKRDNLKSQGYLLGDFPVFSNEYYGEKEDFPISFTEGVEMYKKILQKELEKAPDKGVLVYIQDLELMDYGDLALKIMAEAWEEILNKKTVENRQQRQVNYLLDKAEYEPDLYNGERDYQIKFVTPDQYIDEALTGAKIEHLPELKFNKICWAPEIRLILRADGHYPPLGVDNIGEYTIEKSGIYDNPHVFWENGKYYTGIFDILLHNFNITIEIPVDIGQLGDKDYDLTEESLNTQAVLYARIMKRACNWGWRPTEGRQKRPCLLGYLLTGVLLKKLDKYHQNLILNEDYKKISPEKIVGLSEVLKVFIDSRLNYLKYGLDEYVKVQNKDLSAAYAYFSDVKEWKEKALQQAQELYTLNCNGRRGIDKLLQSLQKYSLAVYMATDNLQRIWGKCPDPEFLVDKMYHYLFELYPPIFPRMIKEIDAMTEENVRDYFTAQKESSAHHL